MGYFRVSTAAPPPASPSGPCRNRRGCVDHRDRLIAGRAADDEEIAELGFELDVEGHQDLVRRVPWYDVDPVLAAGQVDRVGRLARRDRRAGWGVEAEERQLVRVAHRMVDGDPGPVRAQWREVERDGGEGGPALVVPLLEDDDIGDVSIEIEGRLSDDDLGPGGVRDVEG